MTEPTAAGPFALLRAVLAESSEGVVVVDRANRLVTASPTAAQLLGLAPEALRPGELAAAPLEALLARALLGEEVASTLPVGASALAARARPLRGEAGELLGAALWLSEPERAPQLLPEATGADNESSLRAIIETAPGPVIVHRPDGEILLANAAALVTFGFASFEELRVLSIFDLMRPADRARSSERLQDALRDGKPATLIEEQLVRRDGSVARVCVTGMPLVFEGLPAAVVFGVDLSEQREAEAERERLLLESHKVALLREQILESIAEGVWVTDATGNLLYANSAGCRLLGAKDFASAPKSLGQISSQSCFLTAEGARFPPHSLPLLQVLQGRTVRTEALLSTEGARYHVEMIGSPLPGDAGAVAVLHDMTTAKRAEREREELRRLAERSAAELESILLHIADAVLVCDAEGRLALANEAARRLLRVPEGAEGLPVSELLGALRPHSPDGRLHELDELPLERALRGRATTHDELALIDTGDQTLHLRASAAPVVDEHGELLGAVEVLRDVTELVELERLKDEFLAVAAHELKTPVTVVKGYAQAMRRSGEPLGVQTEKLLSAIDRGAERVAAIVQDLVDVSQLELGRMTLESEPLDLGALLAKAADGLAPGTAARVRRFGESHAPVSGDADGLTRVVTALLDNAARYSAADAPIDLELALEGPEAVITVRDRGIGIPKARQARIFERFYRAHTGTPFDRGGIGVRLHLSRELVLRHGGSIGFTSHEGEGSSFCVRLPLAES